MTYNVNYGLAGDPAGVRAIAEADADLVFLQETTAGWQRKLEAELIQQYPHMAFRHCCGAGGLAVLSKFPFTEHEYVKAKAGWFPGWRLVVQSPLGPLQVLNLHLRPQVSDSGSVISGYFKTPRIRRAEIEEYFALLDPSLPTVIVGDLNENHRGRAVGFLEDRGFRSALPEFDGPQDTWRWNTSLGTVRSQLDHLIYDQQLEPLNVQIVGAGRSDHLPVVGTFQSVSWAPGAALPKGTSSAGHGAAGAGSPSPSSSRPSSAHREGAAHAEPRQRPDELPDDLLLEYEVLGKAVTSRHTVLRRMDDETCAGVAYRSHDETTGASIVVCVPAGDAPRAGRPRLQVQINPVVGPRHGVARMAPAVAAAVGLFYAGERDVAPEAVVFDDENNPTRLWLDIERMSLARAGGAISSMHHGPAVIAQIRGRASLGSSAAP